MKTLRHTQKTLTSSISLIFSSPVVSILLTSYCRCCSLISSAQPPFAATYTCYRCLHDSSRCAALLLSPCCCHFCTDPSALVAAASALIQSLLVVATAAPALLPLLPLLPATIATASILLSAQICSSVAAAAVSHFSWSLV